MVQLALPGGLPQQHLLHPQCLLWLTGWTDQREVALQGDCLAQSGAGRDDETGDRRGCRGHLGHTQSFPKPHQQRSDHCGDGGLRSLGRCVEQPAEAFRDCELERGCGVGSDRDQLCGCGGIAHLCRLETRERRSGRCGSRFCGKSVGCGF